MVIETIACVERALAVPRTAEHADTIIDAAGAPVVDAGTFRKDQYVPASWIDRRTVTPVKVLPGTYLFAGELWSHFGHFLFESISRLWAFDGLRGQIDGIVFFRTRDWRQPNVQQLRLLELLGVEAPIVYVDEPTEFGRLHVPRQGCGVGAMSAGTPAFRAFVRNRLGRLPARTDAPAIYLTRRHYAMRRGGILNEDHLEVCLSEEGYLPFAPERHSLDDQIATYLGARRIIGPDSSALHLVGYVCRAETQVGILLRRFDGAKDLMPQMTGFMGRRPEVVSAIREVFKRDNERNPNWALLADLDMPEVWRQLKEAGMIGSDRPWEDLRWRRRARLISVIGSQLGGQLRSVWPGSGALSESAPDHGEPETPEIAPSTGAGPRRGRRAAVGDASPH